MNYHLYISNIEGQISELKLAISESPSFKVLNQMLVHLQQKKNHFQAAREQGLKIEKAISNYSFAYEDNLNNDNYNPVSREFEELEFLVTTYKIEKL